MNCCIDDFITHQGNDCLISCFHNYFMYNGIDIHESDIYFLGEGFSTIYEKTFVNEKLDIVLKSCVPESIEKFCELYNIKFEHYKNISYVRSKEIMQECMEYRNPVIIKLEASCLKHSPVFNNANNVSHCISIIGLKDNSVLISDGFVPTVPASNYQGWYDYNILEEGRRKNGYECVVIDKNSLDYIKSQWDCNKLKDLLLKNVSSGVKRFLSGNEENNIYYGVNALQKFSNEIPYFMDLYGNGYSERMFLLNNIIRTWGITTSRTLLEQVIYSINANYQNCFDTTLIDEIKVVCKKWNSFCFLVVKAAMSKRKNDLELLAQKMNEIINDEVLTFNKILKYI